MLIGFRRLGIRRLMRILIVVISGRESENSWGGVRGQGEVPGGGGRAVGVGVSLGRAHQWAQQLLWHQGNGEYLTQPARLGSITTGRM